MALATAPAHDPHLDRVIAAEVASDLVAKVAGKRLAATVGPPDPAGRRPGRRGRRRLRDLAGRPLRRPRAPAPRPAVGLHQHGGPARLRLEPAHELLAPAVRRPQVRPLQLPLGVAQLGARAGRARAAAGRPRAAAALSASTAAPATSASSGWSGSAYVRRGRGAAQVVEVADHVVPAARGSPRSRTPRAPVAQGWTSGGRREPRGAGCGATGSGGRAARGPAAGSTAGSSSSLAARLIRRISAVSGTPSDGLTRSPSSWRSMPSRPNASAEPLPEQVGRAAGRRAR